jgi:23S rRNA (guanine1835-N2)-methyltransferase
MSDSLFHSPFSPPMALQRYPVRPRELLQAWDSADDLILENLRSRFNDDELKSKRILVVNDAFGALGTALGEFAVTHYSDSFVSQAAYLQNRKTSDAGADANCIRSLSQFEGLYDLVLIKLPKNLSYFEDLLCHLTARLRESSLVITGAMVKHLPASAFDLINRLIGETSTSLAQKKARLIFATFQKTKVSSPYPKKVPMEFFPQAFLNDSNLFSREKLDIGTRFFLEHLLAGLPKEKLETILDLGCGNGVVGIYAKSLCPRAKIIFTDDSYMAIESARVNFKMIFPELEPVEHADFIWINAYENQVPNSLDLVLCNPPFHQANTIGDFISFQMFKDSLRCLKVGGVLRVIGNTHLAYGSILHSLFKNSRTRATHAKFVLIDAVKK